jgi:hypothetical protein
MKHPNREDWVPFLFGEADAPTKKHLAEHLNGCAECADELRAWRKSLRRLDVWKIPSPPRRRLRLLNPVLNFAAAALLILGLAFVLDRASARHTEARLEAAMVPRLRQEIRQELESEWQARLARLQQDSTAAQAEAIRVSGG